MSVAHKLELKHFNKKLVNIKSLSSSVGDEISKRRLEALTDAVLAMS
jgi:hypothetical protein